MERSSSVGTARVHELIRGGHLQAADELCRDLLEQRPDDVQVLLLSSHLAQRVADFPRMVAAARRAQQASPGNVTASLRVIESLIYANHTREALERLQRLEKRAANSHELLHRVAGMYLHCARHADAKRCHARAVELQPENPDCLYDLASSCIATGQLERAESLLNRVIELRPGDFSAWQNRTTLRKQSPQSNHVAALEAALAKIQVPHKDEVPLCFALAKELEDLGEYPRAFSYLARGAARRRSVLSYQVESDLQTMERIRQVFDARLLKRRQRVDATRGPVFVLGLPRTGSTLVDRLLSTHSQVQSLGEVNNLAFGVIGQSGMASGKLELVGRSSEMDLDGLRDAYLRGTRGLGEPGPLLVDKTPSNFLYLGLIWLAMPGARVVHIRRQPMDACYAIFKTLFRAGYPYSYDLTDLGRYYLGYRRLMAHWRAVLPGFIHDVDYEALVQNPRDTAREMLAFCGLEWEEQVLDFHKSPTAAATASAAQVRQPIYTSSVQRWRCYESELAPLVRRLQAAGVRID
jgi:Flp pilus assembly protein TadD